MATAIKLMVKFEDPDSKFQRLVPGGTLLQINSPISRGTLDVLAPGVQMHSCALNRGMTASAFAF